MRQQTVHLILRKWPSCAAGARPISNGTRLGKLRRNGMWKLTEISWFAKPCRMYISWEMARKTGNQRSWRRVVIKANDGEWRDGLGVRRLVVVVCDRSYFFCVSAIFPSFWLSWNCADFLHIFLTVFSLCLFFFSLFISISRWRTELECRNWAQTVSERQQLTAKIKISQNALHRFHFPIVQCARVGRHITLAQRKTERDRNSTTSRRLSCCNFQSPEFESEKKNEVESRVFFSFPERAHDSCTRAARVAWQLTESNWETCDWAAVNAAARERAKVTTFIVCAAGGFQLFFTSAQHNSEKVIEIQPRSTHEAVF